MFSPIKHLKFGLDGHTQKTVAYLENKEENEVKKKILLLPPKQKLKFTQRDSLAYKFHSFCSLEMNDNLLQNLPRSPAVLPLVSKLPFKMRTPLGPHNSVSYLYHGVNVFIRQEPHIQLRSFTHRDRW